MYLSSAEGTPWPGGLAEMTSYFFHPFPPPTLPLAFLHISTSTT